MADELTNQMTRSILHVEFQHPQHGWIMSRLAAGPSVVEFAASHVPYDSITALADALALILKDGSEVIVPWNEEPTEYDFHFLVQGEQCRLTVVTYPNHSRAKKQGKQLLTVGGSRLDVVLPFWRALCRLESSGPLDDFKKDWGHRFPVDKLRDALHWSSR